MKKLVFVAPDGLRREVHAAPGLTLMQAAVAHDVPGIDADCGGSCICATCHVFIVGDAMEKLVPADDMELAMLECAVGYEPQTSRLSCQLRIDDLPDGLEIAVPVSQH